MLFISDTWPQKRLKIEHVLEALCGQPMDGWFVYHEPDFRWMSAALAGAAGLSFDQIAALGIMDLANAGDLPSRQAAGSYAVKLFSHAMDAADEEAIGLVRMNLNSRFEWE